MLLLVTVVLSVLSIPATIHTCDVCGCSFNARQSEGQSLSGGMMTTPSATTLGQGHAAVGFLFEYQRFNPYPAEDAHALNDNGHDVHGKDHEEYDNLSLGYGLLNNLDVFLVTPLVSKTSLQIEDADALGRKEHATDIGDLRFIGKYRFWEQGGGCSRATGSQSPHGRDLHTQ